MNCPACGAAVSPSAKFCMRCRTRVAAGTSPDAPAARTAAPTSIGRNPAQTAALASLVAFLLVILLNAALTGASQREQVMRVVGVAGVGLLALIGMGSGIAGLALIPRYGRKRVLGRAIVGVALCAVVLLAMLNGLREAHQHAQARAEALRTVEGFQGKQQALLDRAAAGEDVAEQALSNSERFSAQMTRSAASLPASERLLSEGLAEAVQRITQHVRQKDTAVRAFTAAGGLSPKGLDSREAIQARLTLLGGCEQANEELLAGIPTAGDYLRARLAARGVSPDRIDRAVKGFTKTMRGDAVAALHGMDRELFAQMRRVLVLLQTNQGRWTYDPQHDSVLFQDPGLAAPYNTALQAINAAAAKQREMQTRLVTEQRAAQGARSESH
jgi:hypothetical protein